MVYRALGGPEQRVLRPRGLRPAATYHVRYTDAGFSVLYTSDQLLQTGLSVALAELGSEVIELELA
jgi:hypothetical protein